MCDRVVTVTTISGVSIVPLMRFVRFWVIWNTLDIILYLFEVLVIFPVVASLKLFSAKAFFIFSICCLHDLEMLTVFLAISINFLVETDGFPSKKLSSMASLTTDSISAPLKPPVTVAYC